MTPQLHTELWTSWASLLRSYAAAHGLNSTQHAVVEVSADEITRFTATTMQHNDAAPQPFALTEDGNVLLNHAAPEEMDFAAEHLARKMMTEPN
jgi:hypothetical protein